MTEANMAPLLALPLEERIDLAEKLWISIDRDTATAALPEWQRALLDERLRDAECNPNDWVSWQDAKARLLETIAAKRA